MSYFTCAQKLTEASVVYHAEPTRKTEKKQGKETKNKKKRQDVRSRVRETVLRKRVYDGKDL